MKGTIKKQVGDTFCEQWGTSALALTSKTLLKTKKRRYWAGRIHFIYLNIMQTFD